MDPTSPTTRARRFARRAFAAAAHHIGPPEPAAPVMRIDYDAADQRVIEAALPHTLTSPERIVALRDAVKYLVTNDVPGAIVECGVWRGGSILAAAMTLIELGASDRDLYLFDSFEDMPPPGEHDFEATGRHASATFQDFVDSDDYAHTGPLAVQRLLVGSGYPSDNIHVVQGMVEDTIPAQAPEEIAVLRLDTDWYESTRHELTHLFPRISDAGVLIVDDYGHYDGARRATDEYLAQHGAPVLLSRIDYSGRMAVIRRAEAPRDLK